MTSPDLSDAIDTRSFRADLFSRLNVVVPSLRKLRSSSSTSSRASGNHVDAYPRSRGTPPPILRSFVEPLLQNVTSTRS